MVSGETPHFEELGGGVGVYADKDCRVGEDALLLARFAAPKESDIVCDLGTGNAVIPLWWCRRHPPRHIDAVERDPDLSELARLSVARSGQEARVRVILADWEDLPAARYDLVTCNPPYFPACRSRQSPSPVRRAQRTARENTLPGLFAAARRLTGGRGRFCFCHRPECLFEVMGALRRAGLVPRRLQWVQTAPRTAPWLFLCEAGERGELRVPEPVITGARGTGSPVYLREEDAP